VRRLPDVGAGVVHQDVEAPAALDRLRDEGGDGVLVGDVGGDRERISPVSPMARSSPTALSDLAALRAAIITRAPAVARARAMPRPIPPLPPVTIATCP
jgi:hypothetical protein